MPEHMNFWQSQSHELDFVCSIEQHLEVKRGQVSPVEFSWWPRSFPEGHLTVINDERFETERIRGITLADFLLEEV